MRSGWSTTVALLPLLLLAGSSAATRPTRAPGARASTPGAGPTGPRTARAGAIVRAAGVEPERLFHAAPLAVSVGGEVDTGSRFDAHDAASDSEPVIVELQIGRIASRTVQAYRVGTEALVPMSVFLQMIEVRFRLSLEGQLEATIDPGGKRLLMDAHKDTISYGDRRIHIEPAFRLFANNELYIGAERLADLFQTSVLVSWEDLTVTFTDASVFPIGRRLRRESARDAFLRRGRGFQAERMLGLERPSWDGLVLDYSFLAPSNAPFSGGSYSAALGADAFGGSLELGVQSIGPAGNGAARIDGSWTGVWEDNRWLKQIRVGDGFTTGPRVRGERGVLLTNSPFVRPSLLGAAHYVGRLEPGWTLEAYRGGDLVAYDSADDQGRFAVELPIRYGENPVDFVAYGPFGEVREFNRTYRVLSELLPDKRFEYGLSAGQCRSALCRGTGNIDLRYGVTRRVTVQGGVDQFWRDSLPNRTHPYAAVVLNPTNALAFTAQGVGGASASAGARFEPSLNLRLDGDYTTYAHDTAPAIAPAGRRSEWGLDAQLRPIPRAGLFVLDAAVAQIRTTGGDVTTGRFAASVQTVAARLAPYVRFERNAAVGATATTRSFAGFDAFVLPRPQLGRVLGPVWMRAHVEAQSGTGFTSGQVFADRPLWSGVRMEAGVSGTRGVRGATFTFVLSSYLPAVRTLTTVTAPPGAPATASQFVQGSLLWNRATGHLAYAPGPSLERAGIAGRVFLDENNNGRWDAGEPPVAGVRVLVGNGSAASDSDGLYHVWDLVPFEPLLVTVDSLSIDSPLLVPAFSSASVVPGPNRFREVDIPLVQAGVLEGRVETEGAAGRHGVGGITLILTDRTTGQRRTFASFTDGAFYLLGVKPGDYDLAVDPQVLDALGAAAEPQRFKLVPTADGVGRSGVEILLRPKP
jgi:hypothetical protein